MMACTVKEPFNMISTEHRAQSEGPRPSSEGGRGLETTGCHSAELASRQNQVILHEKWGVNPIDLYKVVYYGFCPNYSLIQARHWEREKGSRTGLRAGFDEIRAYPWRKER